MSCFGCSASKHHCVDAPSGATQGATLLLATQPAEHHTALNEILLYALVLEAQVTNLCAMLQTRTDHADTAPCSQTSCSRYKLFCATV